MSQITQNDSGSQQFESEFLQSELDSVYCCQCKKSFLLEYFHAKKSENDFYYFYLENKSNKQTKILLLCSACSKVILEINQQKYTPIIKILEDQLTRGLIYINQFERPEVANQTQYTILLSLEGTPPQKIYLNGTLRKGYMFCQQCLGSNTHLELFDQLLIKYASQNGFTTLLLAQKMAEEQYKLDKESFQIYSQKLKDNATSVKEKIYITQKLKILCQRYCQTQKQNFSLEDIKLKKMI